MRKRIRILLADNDADFLQSRREILEAEGYQVVSAAGQEQAQHALKKKAIDLIIVDLRLQDDLDEADISGFVFMRSAPPEVPKILMTAFPTVEMTRRVLKRDFKAFPLAVDVVAKQQGIEALLHAIAQVTTQFGLLEKSQHRRRWQTLKVALPVMAFSGIFAFVALRVFEDGRIRLLFILAWLALVALIYKIADLKQLGMNAKFKRRRRRDG